MAGGPAVVVWDVGGTLVERAVAEGEVVRRALEAAGVRLDQITPQGAEAARQERLTALLRWHTPAEEEAGFRRLAGLLLGGGPQRVTPEQIERVGRYLADYDDVYRPLPGVVDLLDELAARGIRQAVVSNWPPSLRRFLHHHGLLPYFEAVVASAEEGIQKPDPGLLRIALSRLQITPEQAVYVGNDPDLDCAPARGLGMHTIHFDLTGQYPQADARDLQALRERLRAVLALAF